MKKTILTLLALAVPAALFAQQGGLLNTPLPEKQPAEIVPSRAPAAPSAVKPAVVKVEAEPAEKASVVSEKAEKTGFAVTRRHLIVKGDTLWDLSQKYYGDPFMWGRIYNANFSSVANPDLIYPKNELIIPDITEVLIPYRTPEVSETEVSPEGWGEKAAAVERPAVAVSPRPAAPAPDEHLKPFDLNQLSEEMPEHQREWKDGVKIIGDAWEHDGEITAVIKDEDEFLAEALSITGGMVEIDMERSGMVRPGDYLNIYLRGADAYDKDGKRLGSEIQPVGMAEVSSVDGSTVKARVIDASTAVRKGYIVKKK